MLFTATQTSLESRLADLNVPSAQSSQVVKVVVDSAGAAIPFLEDQLVEQQVPEKAAHDVVIASGEAFTDGARAAATAAGLFLILGFASTFSLGSRKEKKAKK